MDRGLGKVRGTQQEMVMFSRSSNNGELLPPLDLKGRGREGLPESKGGCRQGRDHAIGPVVCIRRRAATPTHGPTRRINTLTSLSCSVILRWHLSQPKLNLKLEFKGIK